jgi:hypothetical protein
MSEKTIHDAKVQVSRAFEMLDKYEFGTIGHRDAINRFIPNAIEALVDAKLAHLTKADPSG